VGASQFEDILRYEVLKKRDQFHCTDAWRKPLHFSNHLDAVQNDSGWHLAKTNQHPPT